MPKQTVGRTLRRIQGLHFPPWLPVLFIMVLVSGILVVLFVARGAAGAPRIGVDHWHSPYQIFICGQRQPNLRDWGDGKTHTDGVIHTHPSLPSEEGAGARLGKWFDYGGGKLTQTEMRMPGRSEEHENGQTCDDGSEKVLQVFVNGEKMENWSRYIPHDGDQVRIVFGLEEEEAPEELDDRIVIAEANATRTVELVVSGGEADAAFEPTSIELGPGETVKLVITNSGSISHQVRVAGADGQYNTGDDYVSDPDTVLPGEEGVLVVRFDEEGEFEFQDPTAPNATGTLVVTGEPATETPEPDASQPVDVTIDVSMGDNFFEPAELEVEAGQTFRINLTNTGQLVHNLHITGLDGEYETADDIESEPSFQPAGGTGSLVAQIDEPGVYEFRCDFHPTEQVGTITVR